MIKKEIIPIPMVMLLQEKCLVLLVIRSGNIVDSMENLPMKTLEQVFDELSPERQKTILETIDVLVEEELNKVSESVIESEDTEEGC